MIRAAAILIGLIALLVLAFPAFTTLTIGAATAWFMQAFALPILWLSTLFLLLCLFLVAGPWGRLRLGGESEKPEFGTLSWLSMLFAAGMGSGLVFWGVAEPLFHVANPPLPAGADLYSTAMAVTYFHWGLHAWALYAISGLVIAWFSYRHAAPESPSGVLETGMKGWLRPAWLKVLGVAANAMAIAAVVFGVAGALANGTILLHHGLDEASGASLPAGMSYTLILLALGIAFLASASSGIRRGIRWLSDGNFILALALMLLVLWQSDVSGVLQLLWQGLWRYAEILPAWSIGRLEVNGGLDWSTSWTITYLLWWIAWTPFVGIFIARISRGRSVRAYILGVLGVPVLFSVTWFAVMGGGALAHDAAHDGVLLEAVQTDYTLPLFLWFAGMPGGVGVLLSYLACVLLFVFLVTSADSAAYVMGMLSRRGDPDPPNRTKLLWGSLTVLLAAGLLLRQSADVNKTVAIAGAIPYCLLLLLQVIAWGRSFILALARKAV
ncbi:MAG TPA: BCCT family transporter [Xanthomonadales bacterium]|nr:BCCT family transporter [Xanthomonadales bacterium]